MINVAARCFLCHGSREYRCGPCPECSAPWLKTVRLVSPAEFNRNGEWDAEAHIRLLRQNGGASSGYTADLIEKLYAVLVAESAKLSNARKALEKIAEPYDGEGLTRYVPLDKLGAELRARQNIAKEALGIRTLSGASE